MGYSPWSHRVKHNSVTNTFTFILLLFFVSCGILGWNLGWNPCPLHQKQQDLNCLTTREVLTFLDSTYTWSYSLHLSLSRFIQYIAFKVHLCRLLNSYRNVAPACPPSPTLLCPDSLHCSTGVFHTQSPFTSRTRETLGSPPSATQCKLVSQMFPRCSRPQRSFVWPPS